MTFLRSGESARPGILILSASAGTGHVRAGEALREAFSPHDAGVRVEHVDLLELAPRWVGALYAGSFEVTVKRAPWLWSALYRRTDGLTPDAARWGPLTERLLFRGFQRLLASAEWQCCLCTHFLPCQLLRSGPGVPPLELAVTDFTLHRYWLQRGARRYYVATEALAREVRRLAPWAEVRATGIPVASRFAEPPAPSEARRLLGLEPDRRVALVMGGGMGLGVEDAVRAALEARVPNLQVLAVCGHDAEARRRLASWDVPAARLRVFGYVAAIERLMAAAQIVVTKPGGVTASEAVALGRPLLLTRPIPGHEEGNVRALLDAGAALRAPAPSDVAPALELLFGDPGLLERLGRAARRIGRPRAAQAITRQVLARAGARRAAESVAA